MKLFLIAWISLLTGINPPGKPIEGTYSYKFGKTGKAPYGIMKIHRLKADQYLFYLQLGRGAPDYNSGALYGRLSLDKQNGHYEYTSPDTDGCKLDVRLDKNKLIIKTVSGNCQFGYGVYADETYPKTDPNNPLFFTTRGGRKMVFAKTPPEKFVDD